MRLRPSLPLLLSVGLAACSPKPSTWAGPIFTGMCDASGAVPLTDRTFAVADDEDNVIRGYDADRPGAPLFAVDLSAELGLPVRYKKKKKRNEPRPPPETDLEAATRVGELALWITSHGRNASGKHKPERFRFFATTAPPSGRLEVVGTPYDGLIADLMADPRYAAFALDQAAERAPKDPGGLNIEGMTARAEGGVYIGFRSPVPDGQALIATLLNPEEVVHGAKGRFGDPVRLALGGLGVRGLSSWRGRYLLLAGDDGDARRAQVYVWNGAAEVKKVLERELGTLNPEGFFTPEGRTEVLLLSDDGSALIDGTECKKLDDPRRKRFRGMWLSASKLGG